MSTNEGFLSRWSRRKRDSRHADSGETPSGARDAVERERAGREPAEREQAGREAAAPEAGKRARPASPESAPGAPSSVASAAAGSTPVGAPTPDLRESTPVGEEVDARPIALPPLDSLTPQSDFRPFMQAGVDAATRNAALAKLFRDPHFNVMDGLDVYIDDYNQSEPIPPTMLAKLRQLHSIGLTDDEIERRASANADASPETLARADGAQAHALDAAAEDPREDAATELREDAAAEPNTQETDGEDEGSRM